MDTAHDAGAPTGAAICWSVRSVPLLTVVLRREVGTLARTAAAFLGIGFAVAAAVVWREGGGPDTMLHLALAACALYALTLALFAAVAASFRLIGFGYDYRLDPEGISYALNGGARRLLFPLALAAAGGQPLAAPGAALALGAASGRANWSDMHAHGVRAEFDRRNRLVVLRNPAPPAGGSAPVLAIYVFCETGERMAEVMAFVAARLP